MTFHTYSRRNIFVGIGNYHNLNNLFLDIIEPEAIFIFFGTNPNKLHGVARACYCTYTTACKSFIKIGADCLLAGNNLKIVFLMVIQNL